MGGEICGRCDVGCVMCGRRDVWEGCVEEGCGRSDVWGGGMCGRDVWRRDVGGVMCGEE